MVVDDLIWATTASGSGLIAPRCSWSSGALIPPQAVRPDQRQPSAGGDGCSPGRGSEEWSSFRNEQVVDGSEAQGEGARDSGRPVARRRSLCLRRALHLGLGHCKRSGPRIAPQRTLATRMRHGQAPPPPQSTLRTAPSNCRLNTTAQSRTPAPPPAPTALCSAPLCSESPSRSTPLPATPLPVFASRAAARPALAASSYAQQPARPHVESRQPANHPPTTTRPRAVTSRHVCILRRPLPVYRHGHRRDRIEAQWYVEHSALKLNHGLFAILPYSAPLVPLDTFAAAVLTWD